MEKINVNGFYLNLNLETQPSKNGKLIRLSAIGKITTKPQKYIDKMYRSHWYYEFRYVGTETFVKFEFDYFNKFVGII